MEPIIFMLCLTLHNIEEALWFPEWTVRNLPNRKPTQKAHFIFALIGITTLGYLAAGLHALYPSSQYFAFIFIGFVGAMTINAVFPHLLLSIRYRSYCPGVFTGCCLIIPLHLIILSNMADNHMKFHEIIISTVIVGGVLLGAIPTFIGLARKVIKMENNK